MGKKSKEGIYLYVKLIHSSTETNPALDSHYTPVKNKKEGCENETTSCGQLSPPKHLQCRATQKRIPESNSTLKDRLEQRTSVPRLPFSPPSFLPPGLSLFTPPLPWHSLTVRRLKPSARGCRGSGCSGGRRQGCTSGREQFFMSASCSAFAAESQDEFLSQGTASSL